MGYKLHKTRKELDLLILQSLINAGNVSADKTLDEIVMNKREEILKNHENHHSIWQNKTSGKWHTRLGSKENMVVRKERDDLENAIVEYYLTKENLSATFEDVFNSLCERMITKKTHAMKTVNEYKYDYKRTIADSEFSKMHMSEITERDLTRFLTDIVYREDKLPRKRFNACKTIIRAVFNHAKTELDIDCITVKHVMDDLCFTASDFKDNSVVNDTQVFKISETKKLKVELLKTTDLKELGILLALETGLRLGELCVLTRKDIDDTYIYVNQSEHKAKFDDGHKYFLGEPKKGKKRKVALSVSAKNILNRILTQHNSEWLFPSDKYEDSWMRSYCFDKAIRKVCKRCNMPVRSMHKLRKTYASFLLSLPNIDEKVVQAQLGHADISTTRKCYQYNIWDEDQALAMLQNIAVG